MQLSCINSPRQDLVPGKIASEVVREIQRFEEGFVGLGSCSQLNGETVG